MQTHRQTEVDRQSDKDKDRQKLPETNQDTQTNNQTDRRADRQTDKRAKTDSRDLRNVSKGPELNEDSEQWTKAGHAEDPFVTWTNIAHFTVGGRDPKQDNYH